MDYASARALLERLGGFLDQFVGCFGRRTQREGASRYVQGLLNDSPRKSIHPVTAPVAGLMRATRLRGVPLTAAGASVMKNRNVIILGPI